MARNDTKTSTSRSSVAALVAVTTAARLGIRVSPGILEMISSKVSRVARKATA